MAAELTATLKVCYACGTNETYKDKYGFPKWYMNLMEDDKVFWICRRCYDSVFYKPFIREKARLHRQRLLGR